MRFLFLAAWLVFNTQAQSLPKIGDILDTSGSLRPVFGLSGNFIVGPANFQKILSYACAETICLAKTNSSIVSAWGTANAPAGPAIFGIGANSAIVYFPESRAFARWHDNVLDTLDWVVQGDVLSIRVSGDNPEIAVRRDNTVWIVRPDGTVVDFLVSSGPVLLLAGGTIFTDDNFVILRRASGIETRFGTGNAQMISLPNKQYIVIRTADSIWALRIDPGHEQLSLLPGIQP